MDPKLKVFLEDKSIGYINGLSSSEIEEHSQRNVINLFHKASVRIPAYKNFLKENKIRPDLVKSISDFTKIPETSKENYIYKYKTEDRCWNGKLSSTHTIAASSGSTGEPVFWPRDLSQEIEGAKIHELLFEKIFDANKRKTLFVNSFGLGNWIAGIYTEFCIYLLRLKGYPITLASPGYNQEETYKIIKGFSHLYDQTIIACHPPVLKMMIENGKQLGINWKKLNIKFLGAGEGFSENWRDYLISLINQKDAFHTIINIYGSADAGLMGFETPYSIALHRLTSVNHNLNEKIFRNDRNPYLYQFDPRFKYLESGLSQEVLITTDSSMPLLRYNIHDRGGILKNNFLDKFSDKENSLVSKYLIGKDVVKSDWNFPFIYIFGRDKFMFTLYGVNIYPENIKAVLEHKDLQSKITGRFITEKLSDKNQDQYMLLRVEMRQGLKGTKSLESLVRTLFITILRKLNSEYNQVEDKFKQKMHPRVVFHSFQDNQYFPEGKIKKMA